MQKSKKKMTITTILNRNFKYSVLICPVPRTIFSDIIMNYIMKVQILKIILMVGYIILYSKEILKKNNCQNQIIKIIFSEYLKIN